MVAQDTPPQAGPLRLAQSVGEYARVAAGAAAVAGFALIALTQMGLDWFYGHFGLAPQDVGLDQTAILFETAATGITALTCAAVVGLGVAVVLRYLVLRRSRHDTASPRSLVGQPVVLASASGITIALLAGFLGSGILNAHRSLDDIRAGRSVPPQVLARGEVVARCTQVWWKEPHLDGVIGHPQGARLVYLGEAASVTSFYDATSTRTIRVPSGDVATRSC
jgi:hypothetical protein